MKRACKELMKKNNEREKEISKSNDEIYTDMIVYLRGSDLTEYNQELVREDLINMIIDGQNRGDDIEKVMGGNYKAICDEIIESMPKKTTFQKVMSTIGTSISAAWIVGIIYVIKELLFNIANRSEEWKFTLSFGDIINIVLIMFFANFIVKYICKTSFEKETKVKSFIKNWILGMIMVGAFVIGSYLFNFVVIDTSLIMAIIIVLIIFIIDKVFSAYIDEKVL